MLTHFGHNPYISGIIYTKSDQLQLLSNMILSILLNVIIVANSVLYSVDPQFKISLSTSPNELAHCYYLEKIRQTGWNRFYSYANPAVDMIQQYRAAGYLQGYSTYKEIYYAYVNFYKSVVLNGNPNVNAKVKEFVDNQLDWLDQMCAKNPNNLFWQQTYAILQQLRFMYRGYILRINQQNKLDYYIGFSQFYYLTNVGDLEDIIPALSQQQPTRKGKNCATFIKEIDDTLYVAQNTHNVYSFMLRFHKTYFFPSRNPGIASQWISFTSRPGDLESKDDFYILSSGLVVTETSLGNNNAKNWPKIRSNSIPTWLRHNVAHRLAKNMEQWAQYFNKYRSYTHNNQWILVDFNIYRKTGKAKILMVEEGFEVYAVNDFTDRFYQDGFVAGYNTPYDKNVAITMGYAIDGYETSLRRAQYAQYSAIVKDLPHMKILLRTNNNVDPKQGNAPRYDLDGFAFGQIDQKIVSSDVYEDLSYSAISGPTINNGKYPPFDWRKFSNESHLGMPDVWDFQWLETPIDYESASLADI